MNGRSLEEVSERYRYKIFVKPRQKPRGVVVKILMFITRAILRYFSVKLSARRAFKLHACSVLLTTEVAKKLANRFFDPTLLEN